jgi:acyl-CoA thioester hydrolase
MAGTPSVPFVSSVMTVEPAWIDYNGHLNMAYYNVLFDRAHDEAAALIGLGQDYLKRSNCSFFTAEAHLRYLKEIGAGQRVKVAMRLIAADAKRLHWWQELWTADDAFLSATSEILVLHVDMGLKKVTPFPAEMAAAAEAWVRADAALPQPEGLGRVISLAARPR